VHRLCFFFDVKEILHFVSRHQEADFDARLVGDLEINRIALVVTDNRVCWFLIPTIAVKDRTFANPD
jgi:hypothetical protein